MDKAFYGLTIMDIRVLVFEYCKRHDIDNPFSKEIKFAGEDFVRGFLKRHKDLALRKPQGVALNRVFGLNKEAVKRYFDNLEILLIEHHFEPHQIYKCDETGITTVHKPAKVIAPTGKHCVSSMTSCEKRNTTTVLCACNATGHFVPPMMIFKRKNKKASLTDHAPPGTIQGCSENGWVNTEFFLEFVQHFVKHVSCSQKNPVLMIFDGHKSHTKSLELIDYARENGLFLLSLPPHTTHKLQPLDRAVFKPLNSHFNNACQKWMRNHPGRRIQTENLGELFKESYLKSATLENTVSSFQTSGIVPFNSDIVPADEYIEDPRDNISIATSLTDGNTKIPTNEISICDQSQSNEQIPCTSDNIAGIPETSTTTQTMENNKTTENQVSFETEMTSTALNKSVDKKNVYKKK